MSINVEIYVEVTKNHVFGVTHFSLSRLRQEHVYQL